MPYNQGVQRLITIVLALLIGLPAVSPLLAFSSASDSGRPACCRRDGKHHCMLMDMDSEGMGSTAHASGKSSGTRLAPASISERCPYGAGTLPSTTHADWTLDTANAIFAGIVSHPSVSPQTESKRRISADRSRQKRGPPVENN